VQQARAWGLISLVDIGGTSGGPTATRAPRKSLGDTIKDDAAHNGASQGSRNDPPVYLGKGEKRHLTGMPVPFYGDRTATVSQVQSQFYGWDSDTRSKFLTQLSLAGYNTQGMTDSDMAKAWGAYAEQSAMYYSAGRKFTPWDILAKDRNMRENAPAPTPRTTTTTESATNLSTRGDAHAIFLKSAQSLLGRDPTGEEVKQFQSTLNAYEKAHPTVQTTTSTFLGQDLQKRSTTTKGGVSADEQQMMSMEDIKKDPEYGAYQAATTYFGALMDMIGGG